MSWVAAGVASGAATMAAVKYVKQKRDNKRDEKNRPMMGIPAEIQANLTMSQQQSMQGLPEEQKQQYINNLQRSQAFSLSQASSRKAGLTGVANINQQGVDAYGNMLSMDSQARMQNQDKLHEANREMADYKMQQFDVNVNRPWYQRSAMRRANENELSQNLNQAGSMAGGMNFGAKKQQPINPQADTQRMQTDTQNNNNIYYNPNNPQSGTMYMDGQYDVNNIG